MVGAAGDVDVRPAEAVSVAYCAAGWRQQVIVLAISAAAVLALALKIHMSDTQASVRPERASSPAVAATPAIDPFESTRPVAAASRPSFQDAVSRVRASTLAVRASYGAGAGGQPLERLGSAVVVGPGSYAVTCSHVVAGAIGVGVRRFREPQRWSAARVISSDGDLALLQVAGEELPAAVLGDSSSVGVGEWVLALGYPFQMGLTVTAGIVSRRDATLTFPGGVTQAGLIQTDAAINEGSSGGPLINAAGEVVGINTAIYAPTGVFSGAGFAITSNRVREFVSSILGRTQAAASWGLSLLSLTPELAASLAYPGSRGVVVGSVTPNSAADEARLSRGDVITAIAGQPVGDLASAMDIRDRLARNAAVAIEIWRLGVVRTVTLKPPTG